MGARRDIEEAGKPATVNGFPVAESDSSSVVAGWTPAEGRALPQNIRSSRTVIPEAEIKSNAVAYSAPVGRQRERISRSRALPILTMMGGNASISVSDVRKFTMQARSANFPWTTALER
jgi:hypothetical protein